MNGPAVFSEYQDQLLLTFVSLFTLGFPVFSAATQQLQERAPKMKGKPKRAWKGTMREGKSLR